MAVTIVRVSDGENVPGRFRSVIADVTFDNSYATGGEPIAPADVGLRQILGARHIGGNAAHPKLIYGWDTTNNKLLAFFPTGGGGTSPTSLADPTITAGGTGQAPIIPGQGKEVGPTADLTSITVRVEFIGN